MVGQRFIALLENKQNVELLSRGKLFENKYQALWPDTDVIRKETDEVYNRICEDGKFKEVMDVLLEFAEKLRLIVWSMTAEGNKPAETVEKENGFGVIIAGAGMAAALAGVLAAHTTLPVIGVPLISAVLEGTDALLATVMMPSGIPVATVAIDGSKNAAYLAAEIIALSDESLAEKIAEDRKKQSEAVLKKDAGIQEKIKEL